MRVVIVGGGMAGTRLAAELSTRDTAGRLSVTVVGAEQAPGYNRVLLGDLLAGQLSTSDLRLPGSTTAAVRTGDSVVGLDLAHRSVRLRSGATLGYDALVLATGSAPVLPPLPAPHVYPLRTVADYTRLLDALPGASRVVVVGGGPLGVETASTLAGRGIEVALVHRHGRLLPADLDAEGGGALRRFLRSRGVTTWLASAAVGLRTARRGRLDGVELDGGRCVPADLVVVACGAQPRVALARGAGLRLAAGGVAVDDALRTSDPHVYAVGDCAAHPGARRGHATPAWSQAGVLADRLSGRDPAARYRGTPHVLRLRAGLEVVAAGDQEASQTDRVVQVADGTRHAYHRLVVRAGRVAGLVAIGEHDAVPTFVDWYERGTPVPAAPFGMPSDRRS